MRVDEQLRVQDLLPQIDRFFACAASKVRRWNTAWNPADGAPVFTVRGKYTTRGWTEWTQGFQFGAPLLIFDATGDTAFYELGRANTLKHMASHVTHIGVHDHGFNNVSTYGALRRLANEGRVDESADARHAFDLALQASGAVQAARWTTIHDGTGFIHSFNGPHSLFSDTVRSIRSLMLADRLGHALMGEGDQRISLLDRGIQHLVNTARYNVYYGEGRDHYDLRGRVVHESIFNTNDGQYRCPSTQQGYSPFTTWTRGLAWIVLGASEQLEYLATVPAERIERFADPRKLRGQLLEMAKATAQFYISESATDGIPYWDTGAPELVHLGDPRLSPSQPDNPYEPVDSSAAAITAQGLLRLGNYIGRDYREGRRFYQAGLNVAKTLFAPPYVNEDPDHDGLILHAIYHRPNGWDHIPDGKAIPQGEACMWGDYHALELAVYLQRESDAARPYLTFWGPDADAREG